MKKHTIIDYVITIEIILIGFAEAAHLTGVLPGWSFSRVTAVFWGLTGAGLAAGICYLFMRKHIFKKLRARASVSGRQILKRPAGELDKTELVLSVIFAIMVLSQLIFICMGDTVYRDKDMTAETVGSFLASDGVYRVNPMTGFPYQTGIPSRLKILCLPTLYGAVCKATGLAPTTVIRVMVPAVTLLSSYGAFAALGHCLFSEDRKKRICFLIAAALLLWVGTYRYGVDGFNLLLCGWRGVAIRNGVLVPWALSLCLRKKWISAVICVLAEACIVWTFYGCGVCAALIAGMAGSGIIFRVLSGRENTR